MDIAVRSDDRPMIAYRGEFGEVATYSCSDIDCTTGTLGGVTVGNPSHGTGIALSLRDDDIGVVSYSSDGDNSLMLAVCADTNCTSAPARVIDVPASQDTAVAVAGLLPRVAYGGGGTVGDDDMRLYVCSNSTCSVGSPRIVEASSGFYSAVAVRADGRPVVAYRSSKTGDVRIHVCSNAQCN